MVPAAGTDFDLSSPVVVGDSTTVYKRLQEWLDEAQTKSPWSSDTHRSGASTAAASAAVVGAGAVAVVPVVDRSSMPVVDRPSIPVVDRSSKPARYAASTTNGQ